MSTYTVCRYYLLGWDNSQNLMKFPASDGVHSVDSEETYPINDGIHERIVRYGWDERFCVW